MLLLPEPAQDLFGTFVGRKDGIEDVLDSATPNNHGEALEALEEPHFVHFEGWYVQLIA